MATINKKNSGLVKPNKAGDRPRGGIHPIQLPPARYKAPQIWPSKLGDDKKYGTLTDRTNFQEYAWEFLRRNRYFQIAQLSGDWTLDETLYGASTTKDRPRTWGLASDHHHRYSFCKPHSTITAIWAAAKPKLFVNSQIGDIASGLEYPASQVVILFDLGPQLNGHSCIDAQIKEAKRMLLARSKKFEGRTGVKEYPENGRRKLRDLLRIVDLFSNGYSFPEVSKKMSAFWKTQPTEKKSAVKRAETDVSSYLKIAYQYIYECRYLELVWIDAVSPEPDQY